MIEKSGPLDNWLYEKVFPVMQNIAMWGMLGVLAIFFFMLAPKVFEFLLVISIFIWMVLL